MVRLVWAMLLVLVLVLVLGQAKIFAAGASLGEELYNGRQPLAAHLRADDIALPATAAACVNCHEPAMRPGSTPVAAPNIGPRLDATLLQSSPRRGGPPSEFAEESFCRLLRTGVDPAMVLVRRTMPVFQLSNAECSALWQFLSQRPAPVGLAP